MTAAPRFVLAYLYLTEGQNSAADGQLKTITQLQPGDRVSAQLLQSMSKTTTAAAAARCGRKSGTKPVSSTRGPASSRSDRGGPLGAQDPIQRPLHRWHRGQPPLPAPGRGQGLELEQPLGEAFPHARSPDQHDIAAVSLHGLPALLGIELVVDQHHRCQVVASRQLGH